MTLRRWSKATATFAFIRVIDKDGSVRAWKITAEEYASLASGGTRAAMKLGVTKEEWESGQASACGNGMDVGDVALHRDGSITIKISEGAGSDLTQDFLQFSRNEYTGTVPNITVPNGVLIAMDKSKMRIVKSVDGIASGVLQWQSL